MKSNYTSTPRLHTPKHKNTCKWSTYLTKYFSGLNKIDILGEKV